MGLIQIEKESIHVLLVDDEADFLTISKKILETEGAFQIDTALSVDEATKKHEKKRFDVIVSDYKMPGKDGLEFLKELRDGGDDAPFIIFTGKDRDEIAIKALNLGADHYIRKIGDIEFMYGELSHAMSRLVNAKRAVDALRESETLARERKLVEEKLRKLNNLQTAIRHMHQALLRTKTESELFQKVCDSLEKVDFIKFAWIGLVDKRNLKVNPITSAGGEDKYLSAIKVMLDESEQGKGPTSMAIKKSQPFVIHDIETDPRHIPLKKEAMKRGFLSMASLPLVHRGEVIGAYTVYSGIKHTFEDEEVEFLKEVANDIAVGIKALRSEKERKLAEWAMEERVKEIECLYGIARLIEKYGTDIDSILNGAVVLIPPAFQYPEITCARITCYDQVFETANFKETKWKQSSDIKVNREISGAIEVCHLKEKPESDEGQFLKEERDLIETIADRLGDAIESSQMERKLKRVMNELKSSNKKLKESNIDLENYTYMVSHDLKTPLRSVRSFSSFLLEDYFDEIDETGQDYLHRIVNAGDHMDSLIEDLLLLSRVGRKFMNIEKVDLNVMLEEIEEDLNAMIQEQNAEIVAVKKLPTILIQKTWVKQLFTNLLANGLNYNTSKAPMVEVLCDKRMDEYLFKIRDNGIGIEKKYHERIFNLFERLHSREEYEGTGAGLAICKKIVENFGGRIWVESIPGKGSTFFFTIPKKSLKESKKENEDAERED